MAEKLCELKKKGGGGGDSIENVYSFLWTGYLSGMQLKEGTQSVIGGSATITINGITFSGSGSGANLAFTASVAGTWYYDVNRSNVTATHANANTAVTVGSIACLVFVAD